MFPFNLRGPEFLLFYLVFGVLVLVLARRCCNAAENGPRPRLKFDDPYRLAYLRSGAFEVLRVAAVSLIDRRLLRVDGERLTAAGAGDASEHDVEQLVLRHFDAGRAAESVFSQHNAANIDARYRPELEQLQLIPDEAKRVERWRRAGVLIALLLSVAASKVLVAWALGRSNVGFLIALAAVTSLLVLPLSHPRLTVVGRGFLRDVTALFEPLRRRADRIAAGGPRDEALLLAALFGIGALPASKFAIAQGLFKRGSSSGTSGGSSCGSGTSCGSGCGGGGGCGGCGG